MPLSPFDYFVWAASFIGHIVLLIVLCRRDRHKHFPAFTALIIFNLIRSCILFPIRLYPAHYFNAFWALAGVEEALLCGVLYESASIVFRPAGAWARDVKTALWAIAGVSVVVAVCLTVVATPTTQTPVQTAIIKGKFLAATIGAEFFVGMMALAVRAGLPWRSDVARICQGLGLYIGACVIMDTAITCYGIRAQSDLYTNLSHLRILIYLVCLTYWIVTLNAHESAPDEMPELLRRQLVLLQQRLDADLVRLRSLK